MCRQFVILIMYGACVQAKYSYVDMLNDTVCGVSIQTSVIDAVNASYLMVAS